MTDPSTPTVGYESGSTIGRQLNVTPGRVTVGRGPTSALKATRSTGRKFTVSGVKKASRSVSDAAGNESDHRPAQSSTLTPRTPCGLSISSSTPSMAEDSPDVRRPASSTFSFRWTESKVIFGSPPDWCEGKEAGPVQLTPSSCSICGSIIPYCLVNRRGVVRLSPHVWKRRTRGEHSPRG